MRERPEYLTVLFVSFCLSVCFGSFLLLAPLRCWDVGMGLWQVGVFFFAYGLANAASFPFYAWLCQSKIKYGLVSGSVLNFLSLLLLSYQTGFWFLLISFAFYGLAVASLEAACSVLLGMSLTPEELERSSKLVFLASSTGFATGCFVGGWRGEVIGVSPALFLASLISLPAIPVALLFREVGEIPFAVAEPLLEGEEEVEAARRVPFAFLLPFAVNLYRPFLPIYFVRGCPLFHVGLAYGASSLFALAAYAKSFGIWLSSLCYVGAGAFFFSFPVAESLFGLPLLFLGQGVWDRKKAEAGGSLWARVFPVFAPLIGGFLCESSFEGVFLISAVVATTFFVLSKIKRVNEAS